MITVVLKNGNRKETVEFPCSERILAVTEERLENDGSPFVDEILSPKHLSAIAGHFVDVDELNYLAKRLESFDTTELNCFLAVAQKNNMSHLPELINLTFNSGAYVLISDMSSLKGVGQRYVLTTRGGISNDELEKMDLEKIGRDLLNSGKGEITECGILFKNEEWQYEEPYDGENFPLYDYRSSSTIMELTYNGKNEYLYLPDEEIAIDKAVKRLGAEKIEDCHCSFVEYGFNDTSDSFFEKLLDEIKEKEGVFGVNNTLDAISETLEDDKETEKLVAVIEHTGKKNSKDIKAIVDNFDSFIFVEGALDHEDVGRFFIDNVYEYYFDSELEDYIDFDGFGEMIDNDFSGEFIRDLGYVCLKENASMNEIFDDDENEEISQTM